jgi:hypothetical protein
MTEPAVELTVDELVNLIIQFHLETGADLEKIKVFAKKVGDLTLLFTMNVIRKEMTRPYQN